jgi:hypothetical protein
MLCGRSKSLLFGAPTDITREFNWLDFTDNQRRRLAMDALTYAVPVAAAGYSLVYLLAGGGFGGALVIFIIAKMLGR